MQIKNGYVVSYMDHIIYDVDKYDKVCCMLNIGYKVLISLGITMLIVGIRAIVC